MATFIEQLGSGVGIGAVYALIALGFVMIYKATDVVNFATGEFLMLGTFLMYSCIVFFNLPISVAIILALLGMAVFGAGIDRFVLRRLLGEPVMSVIAATLAIALIVRSVCAIIWGFDVLAMPTFIQDRPIDIGGVIVSSLYTVSLIVLVCLIAVLYLFFQYTKVGIAMQATAQNQFSSYLMGIGVGNIFSLTWAIAGMCCCIAGILLAPIGGVHIHMSAIGLKAFPAAILGGMTSLPGAIVGGIIIGVTESLSAYYAPLVKDSIAFFILLVVLFVRPEGIFGSHQIKKV